MVSYYQHLSVAEKLRAVFGPFVNPFDHWAGHQVLEFPAVKISQLAPVVFQDGDGRKLELMRWGLVPPWFRGDAAEAKKFQGRTFNARSETLAEKSSFKSAWGSRRCLVPATGFTEYQKPPGWKRGDKKQPVRVVAADGGTLAFGGLWGRKTVQDEVWLTFTIITTPPNAVVKPLHHRMPLVLAPQDWEAWLDPARDGRTDPALQALLCPPPDDALAVEDA